MGRVANVTVTAALVASAIALGPRPVGGQAPTAVFKAGVDAVVVNASVRDERGRIVRNLKKADFEVIDSGFGRPIREFYAGNAPVSLAVLLDISGSMGVGGNIERARQAVAVAMTHLKASRGDRRRCSTPLPPRLARPASARISIAPFWSSPMASTRGAV
jgi:hypothetical protein